MQAKAEAAVAADLEQLVAEADTGGRKPDGLAGRILLWVALAWSLFQLWYASPLPFIFGLGILNDTEARSIHLGFALFLAFTAYPAFKSSSRDRIPAQDWLLAVLAALCRRLSVPVLPTNWRHGRPADLARPRHRRFRHPAPARSDAPLARPAHGDRRRILHPVHLRRPLMPSVLQHKGVSLSRFLTHQWLITEGVFGIALGVSTSFVFLFVLFGTLLDKAGAGNWMMQISIALLGHLRGGPAKVAVISSALNGVVSGSSVSNVVSGGIFTIPLMKRTGLSGVKAGAIEASSSINGQIMPPVMGAAAFLMVEYVGIPYSEIIKHAVLPAVLSYVSLLYIVHLEAVKIGSKPIPREKVELKTRLLRSGLGVTGSIVVLCLLYYGVPACQGRCSARRSLAARRCRHRRLSMDGLVCGAASPISSSTIPMRRSSNCRAPGT